jgi:hypothetical protein
MERQREHEYDQLNGLMQYGQVAEEEKVAADQNNLDANSH